jgi:hypothetical protein
MELSQEIISAETRFQSKLEEFFLIAFNKTRLESHGIDHHRRVWRYSKELLKLSGNDHFPADNLLPVKMIIASYLHDIGMSIETGTKHGLHSRNFCEKFLNHNDLPAGNYTDMLDAVENHDDKEYTSKQAGNTVLQMLSVADDLDAFGYTGIYRYLEIYTMRGVKFDLLGEVIIKNVTGRFRNLEKIYGDNPCFMARHQPRFATIIGFFHSYSSQAEGYQFGKDNHAGWCGVAELIAESVNKGVFLRDLINNADFNEYDNIIKQYFTNLRRELTL